MTRCSDSPQSTSVASKHPVGTDFTFHSHSNNMGHIIKWVSGLPVEKNVHVFPFNYRRCVVDPSDRIRTTKVGVRWVFLKQVVSEVCDRLDADPWNTLLFIFFFFFFFCG